MHFFKVPALLPVLVPSAIWRVRTSEKMIFLTFDDGPHPEVTPWVLEVLAQYDAKATFFCVGNNLSKFPHVAKEILNQGHHIGNHTYQHSKGWITKNTNYFKEIEQTEALIGELHMQCQKIKFHHSLFRPPYGRISPSQLQWAKKRNIPVIMWSMLSCDYDPKLNCEKALQTLQKNIKPGNIVVFHDSQKAFPQLKQLLPRFLEFLVHQGFRMQLLSNPQFNKF
jgi:peptidoglycan/xylan/chitin deacetylase (PgdA/CDA1 family)